MIWTAQRGGLMARHQIAWFDLTWAKHRCIPPLSTSWAPSLSSFAIPHPSPHATICYIRTPRNHPIFQVWIGTGRLSQPIVRAILSDTIKHDEAIRRRKWEKHGHLSHLCRISTLCYAFGRLQSKFTCSSTKLRYPTWTVAVFSPFFFIFHFSRFERLRTISEHLRAIFQGDLIKWPSHAKGWCCLRLSIRHECQKQMWVCKV